MVRELGGGSRVRFAHTYENIISIENLLDAWKEFVKGKKNKPDVQVFGLRLIDTILELHEELRTKTYRHGGYQSFRINDPKPRHIHKARVRDRLVHHAIYRKLYPYFEHVFIYDSYSCRNGKGTHKAMDRFRQYADLASYGHTRTCWVLKCDIKKFFASVDHAILVRILQNHILDERIVLLLERVIKSFSTTPGVGLPLGNLTSQLFANVYLDELDRFVKHTLKAHYYIRYADDFVFLSDSKTELRKVLSKSKPFLSEELRLDLHPEKVSIKTLASGVDFLGWVHFPDHRVLRTSTKRRILKRTHSINFSSSGFASYIGLLKHGNAKKIESVLGLDTHTPARILGST